jgi:hypothetical protein
VAPGRAFDADIDVRALMGGAFGARAEQEDAVGRSDTCYRTIAAAKLGASSGSQIAFMGGIMRQNTAANAVLTPAAQAGC